MKNKKMDVLCDFDILYDVDYGIIKTIVDKYNNTKFTNDDYLRKVTLKQLQEDMANQKERDPLKLVFKEGVEYKSLYDELYTNNMEDIVHNSITTDVFKLMIIYIKMNLITLHITCKNKYQEQRIKSSGLDFIYHNDIDVNKYNCVYMRSCENLLSLDDLPEHCNIYLANCEYNKSDDEINIPHMKVVKYFFNNIELIDLY